MKHDPLHPSPEDLFAYRDGELPHERRAVIEAHVMGCSSCRSLIDEVSSLEADLRRAPEGAPAEYFERLPGAVRERIAREAPAAEAPARGPRTERRRAGEAAREGGAVGTAPKLPWAAVLSTASAAAAVVVVVLILVNRGAFRQAVSPLPPPARVPGAVPGAEPPQPSDSGAWRSREKAGAVGPLERDAGSRAVTAPVADSAAPMVAGRITATKTLGKDEFAARANEEAKPVAPAPARVTAEAQTAMPEPSSALADGKKSLRSDYDSAIGGLGLPPVWNERVSPDALGRAEPRLRLLYVTGRAGADSARVRLYLAEAARLRYAPGDSALFDLIVHHYRRAIRLAGPGTDVARVAAERLGTLER